MKRGGGARGTSMRQKARRALLADADFEHDEDDVYHLFMFPTMFLTVTVGAQRFHTSNE
ncbi:hypothetical protein JB92DRAFT_2936477 [Gautieria morchelliformis]|nr:hypothetical protein JB92DRAFT_2936477 [Gautieria morchelliformis]